MKDYKEMAQSVLERRDAVINRKRKYQRAWIRYGLPAICLLLIIGLGFTVIKQDYRRQSIVPIDSSLTVTDQSMVASVSSSPVEATSSPPPPSNAPIDSSVSFVASQPPRRNSMVEQSESIVIQQNSAMSDFSSVNSSVASAPAVSESDKNKDNYDELSYTFDSLNSFMGHLNVVQPYAPPASYPSSAPAASRPDVSSSDEAADVIIPEDDSANQAVPDASPPTGDVPTQDDESLFWEKLWNMFDDGTVDMPALANGNSLLQLRTVGVNDAGVYYYYRFVDTALQSDERYDLMIEIAAENSALYTKYNQVVLGTSFQKYEYNGIVFIVKQVADDMYEIYWQQDGEYFAAYYNGDAKYFSQILSGLKIYKQSWCE